MLKRIYFFLACLALLTMLVVASCVPGESPTPTIPADTPEPEPPAWLRIYTDIDFNGPSLGLISGWRGVIMRSGDGGQNWSKVPVPLKTDLNSIAILDANTAIAVGSNGNILRSTDSGNTWEKITSPTSETLNAVTAISGGGAVAVGWHGTIIATLDGGMTWSSSLSDDFHAINFEAVDFTEDGTGMTISSTGQVFKTSNAADWQQLTLPDTDLKLYSVDLFDQYTAFVAGNIEADKAYRYGGKTVVLKTPSGGQNWEYGPRDWNADLLAIRFIDDQNALASGWDGEVFRTDDGGLNWSAMTTNTRQALRSIAVVDTNTIFMVGDGQTIIRSQDSGYTWGEISGS